MNDQTSVYLYYDARGSLIYVGITKRGQGRQLEHNAKAEWWSFVARQEVEHYGTRDEAALREKFLIRDHRPPFNQRHNKGWEQLRAAYLTLYQPVSLPCAGGAEVACHACAGVPCPGGEDELVLCDECYHDDCPYSRGYDCGSADGYYTGQQWLTGWAHRKMLPDSTQDVDLANAVVEYMHAATSLGQALRGSMSDEEFDRFVDYLLPEAEAIRSWGEVNGRVGA